MLVVLTLVICIGGHTLNEGIYQCLRSLRNKLMHGHCQLYCYPKIPTLSLFDTYVKLSRKTGDLIKST